MQYNMGSHAKALSFVSSFYKVPVNGLVSYEFIKQDDDFNDFVLYADGGTSQGGSFWKNLFGQLGWIAAAIGIKVLADRLLFNIESSKIGKGLSSAVFAPDQYRPAFATQQSNGFQPASQSNMFSKQDSWNSGMNPFTPSIR